MATHLAQVKAQLTLQSRRKVLSELEGEFTSVRTGSGTDFHDLREYVRGDEVKHLDWKASARTGGLLVKRFSAVRKHTVLLALSTGRSMAALHTLERTKGDVAGELAGLVGWLAARQGDEVTVVHGDAEKQSVRPPRTGEVQVDRGIDAAVHAVRADGPASDTAALLRAVTRHVRRRTILLLVCDTQDATPALRAALRRVVVQHDVLAVTIGDLDPASVPVGAPTSRDVDSGWVLPDWVRADSSLAAELVDVRAAQQAEFHRALSSVGVVHEHLPSGGSTLSAVRRVLLRHRHARHR